MQGLYEYEEDYQGSFLGAYSDNPSAYANLDEFANEVLQEFDTEFDSFYDDHKDEETANEAIIASIKKRSKHGYARISEEGYFIFCLSQIRDSFPVLYFEVD